MLIGGIELLPNKNPEHHTVYLPLSMQMVKGARELNEELVKGVAFAISKGVAGLGTAVWVNGLLITSTEGVPWEQMIPYQLQVEQQRLQVCVPTSYTSKVFWHCQAYPFSMAMVQRFVHANFIWTKEGKDRAEEVINTWGPKLVVAVPRISISWIAAGCTYASWQNFGMHSGSALQSDQTLIYVEVMEGNCGDVYAFE